MVWEHMGLWKENNEKSLFKVAETAWCMHTVICILYIALLLGYTCLCMSFLSNTFCPTAGLALVRVLSRRNPLIMLSTFQVYGYATTADGYAPDYPLPLLFKVEDDNDNAPYFETKLTVFSVPENCRTGKFKYS